MSKVNIVKHTSHTQKSDNIESKIKEKKEKKDSSGDKKTKKADKVEISKKAEDLSKAAKTDKGTKNIKADKIEPKVTDKTIKDNAKPTSKVKEVPKVTTTPKQANTKSTGTSTTSSAATGSSQSTTGSIASSVVAGNVTSNAKLSNKIAKVLTNTNKKMAKALTKTVAQGTNAKTQTDKKVANIIANTEKKISLSANINYQNKVERQFLNFQHKPGMFSYSTLNNPYKEVKFKDIGLKNESALRFAHIVEGVKANSSLRGRILSNQQLDRNVAQKLGMAQVQKETVSQLFDSSRHGSGAINRIGDAGEGSGNFNAVSFMSSISNGINDALESYKDVQKAEKEAAEESKEEAVGTLA